jgi:hypothetical protein
MAYDPGPLPQEPESLEEEIAFRDRMAEVAEEKRRALEDPGPGWREWFLFSALKWYLGLTFLIVDSWIAVGWLQVGNYVGLFLTLIAAVYLEFLCYRVLWRRPPVDRPVRSTFRPNWYTPVQFGRFTPEAELYREGRLTLDGPNPREFL